MLGFAPTDKLATSLDAAAIARPQAGQAPQSGRPQALDDLYGHR